MMPYARVPNIKRLAFKRAHATRFRSLLLCIPLPKNALSSDMH
ncbi:hypothetical protein M728_001561 [Ensifer sp. WSM1721]